jgi:ribulose bisphosphate carboxylase small subunit
VDAPFRPNHGVSTKPGQLHLDSVVANSSAGFGHIEEQALRDVRWQVHLLAAEARAAGEWLQLTCMTADHSDNHVRVVANLDGTREAYRRRAIVAVRDDPRGLERAEGRSTTPDRHNCSTRTRPTGAQALETRAGRWGEQLSATGTIRAD